ncbi:MAG: CDP-glucose 4,6-dehydratase [Flavobacteriales bacterium]|nr:CDP-glucose 4,6-dehydratase [Flavobacteriales bacterium]
MFNNFYKDKKVLVTGNTGFKGSWLSLWLKQMGAVVYGISDRIPTKPSLFEILNLERSSNHTFEDIRNLDALKSIIKAIAPDIIFHLAAQPIVKLSYDDPIDTFSTNVMGTAHMLEAARELKNQCLFISITSDKCYDNQEWEWGYRENDALGGKDPYSASKAAAEITIRSYYESFFKKDESNIKLCSVRAGNVIGGGDWADSRLIPDIYRAWSEKESVHIRSPHSTRPWQHVLEPLSGYLSLAQHLSEKPQLNGMAFNFGPNANQNHSVLDVLNELEKYWSNDGQKELFSIQENSDFHEAGLLKLNCDRALHELQWRPTLEFESTLAMTAKWYNQYYNESESDMIAFSQKQIESYVEAAKKQGIPWAK